MRIWLRRLRLKYRMSYKDAALISGISREHFVNIEKGIRNPSIKYAKKIAKAFNFEWTKFFEETNET